MSKQPRSAQSVVLNYSCYCGVTIELAQELGMFVLTQQHQETDDKTWQGMLPTPTPGREAESLIGPLPSYMPLFQKTEILTLEDIFKLNIAKFVYMTLCGESPSIFSDWFVYVRNIHSYATTSSSTISTTDYFDTGTEFPTLALYTPKSKLVNYGDKLIKVCGPHIWNSLPPYIQEASSIYMFKKHIRKYFLQTYNEQH